MYKFATTNSNFEKISYFRHASLFNVHVAYINFQQNHASKNCHTNYFAKIGKLLNFQLPIVILEKKRLSQTCIIV